MENRFVIKSFGNALSINKNNMKRKNSWSPVKWLVFIAGVAFISYLLTVFAIRAKAEELIAPEQAVYEPMTQEDLTPIVVDTQSENYKRAMRWAEHKEGDPRPSDWDTNMTIVEFE